MPIQLFPITGGLNQHIDRRLLPDGALADAVNCELERQGRIVGRAKYTALASTVYGSGTFVGYDLFSIDDRLFAIGDRKATGYATDVFEYVTGGAAAWVPSDRSAAAHRLPRATGLREIARPPDVSGGVSNFSCAALGGFVLLAYNNDDPDGVDNGYLHALLSARDQTVLFDELSTSGNNVCLKLKALALSDRFIILGTNAAADRIGARRFIPASEEASASLSTTLYTGLGAVTVFAACKVDGSDQFVVIANCAGTLIVRRFDSAGTLQVPSGGAYANITAAATRLSVYANVTDNHVVVGYEVAGALTIQSYDLSVGTTLASAVSQLAGVGVGDFNLLRAAAGTAAIVASGTDANPEDSVYLGTFDAATGLVPTSVRLLVDATLTSTAILQGGEIIFSCRYGSTATKPLSGTNVLASGVFGSGFTLGFLQILAVKNLETAGPPGIHLPEIVLDSTTSRYYWANNEINPDSDGAPQVTEFRLGSTDRRQTARFGELVYIAGGLPLVFDGRMLTESGFTERPRIVTLTASNGAGVLLSGGSYKYRLHLEQVDAAGNLHLSPPSEIAEVTLGASDDTVTALVSSSHGIRRNVPAATIGVSVRHVISRTLASVTNAAAIVIGTVTINPPSATLSTLTLLVIGGGTSFTVTFSAAATTQAQTLTEINAIVSAEITATAPNGVLILTSVDTGDTASIQILGGTANGLLGLTEGTLAQGQTTRTVGENFQRAAAAYNPTLDQPGEMVTIVDTRKDESDPIVETDLIRQQVLYSQGVASAGHHAPPPGDYIWAGRERVVIAGQPKRGRFTVSKLIVPAAPAEFAAEGFIAYSGQVSGQIEAIATVVDAIVLFTRTSIWMVTGNGPNRAGQGEFNQAQLLTRAIGLIADGWRSLVEDDEGLWFQGSDAEIYRLSKGGSIEWLGAPVREYLETYPVVTAAVYRQSKGEVCFAVTNSAGTTGGILRRNAIIPEAPAWFFDDVGAVSSLADYQGRLSYVQSGTVYLQDAAPGSGTFVTYYVDSGLYQGFQGLGYGALEEIGVLGTYRGPCTVTILLGTNGVDFPTTVGAIALTAAEYSVGQRVQLLLDPVIHQFDSFALRARVTYASTDSEGVWLHAFAVKTETQPDFVRLAPSRRV